MSILLPERVLAGAAAHHAWLGEHVPLFECPDPVIQDTYYFRWHVYREHIRRTPIGHVVTEFLDDVPWAGAYNTISCAAGHHLYEGRWLRDAAPLDDYARFWFRPEAPLRRYSSWLADAVYARALVTGDTRLPQTLLDDLVRNHEAWEAERRDATGLFWQLDDADGMEYQIGGSGCRPTINSYLYGDALAIARIATLAGRADLAEVFRARATRLRRLVHEHLWDPEARFFKTLPTEPALASQAQRYRGRALGPDQPLGRPADVRELIGYIPWCFNLPDPGHEVAWAQLTDPAGFHGIWGPTTAERRHPAWQPAPLAGQHECLWRGASWPYATAQTLVALANLLRHYEQRHVSRDTYLALMRAYARSHRLVLPGGAIPWIDESLHPDTGAWVTRVALHALGRPDRDRGRDYNHSTFCDLVIAGLVGLRPRPDEVVEVDPLVPDGVWPYFCLDRVRYHGHDLTILYDANGTRYGQGAGLRIQVDGREVAAGAALARLQAPLDG
jgi:hypothetical protein